MSNFGTIGQDPRYSLPGGRGYTPEAGNLYQQEHFIDPESGQVMGPLGAPPHTANPLQWQTAHTMGVERARFNLGRAGTDYLQGALGNLQSFRPGGHAAMASGVYGQLAQGMFTRASMLQPIDLLSDFRREAEFQANRAGSWKNKIRNWTGAAQSVLGVAQTVGNIVGSFAGGGAGPMPPGLPQQQPATAGQPAPGGGGGMGMGAVMGAQMGAEVGTAAGGAYTQPGYQQQMQQTFGQQRQPQGNQPPGAGPGPGGPGGGPAPGGTQQRQQSGGGGPQQQGAGQGMMGGIPFGASGDFSPMAMAVQGAAESGQMAPIRNAIMQKLMLEQLRGDADFQAIDYAISRQAALRGLAA